VVYYPTSGASLNVIESWGSKLFAASLFYTALVLVITFTSLASGEKPPQLLPQSVMQLYSEAYSTWQNLSGQVFTGSMWDQIVAAFNAIQSMWELTLGVLFTITFSFVWIGYAASSLLPEPLAILRVGLWAASVFANLILILYLLKTVQSVISNFIYTIRGG